MLRMPIIKCSYWMLSECCENKGQRGCTFWKPHKPLYPIQDSEVGIQVIGQVLDHQGLPHYHGQIMKRPPREIIPHVPGNFLQDLYNSSTGIRFQIQAMI